MMTNLHFFTAADMPQHLLWQIRSFMRMHWSFLFGPEQRLLPGLWWLETLHPVHVVLAQDDVVISYGAIVRKELDHAGQSFVACGLHGVFTFPDFRHEGYGAQLVTAVTNHLQEHSQADIAILFCPPELVPFYGAAGWEHREDAVTLVGPVDGPSQVEADPDMPDIRMMLFLSQKGKQAREIFWDRPFYFGGSGW